MWRLGSVLAVLLVVLAGCSVPAGQSSPSPVTPSFETPTPAETAVSTPVGTPTQSSTDRPATTTATETRKPTVSATPVSLASSGTPCTEDLWIDFWRPQNDKGGWTQNSVRVSYTLPANTSIFLVTYVDGSVAGVSFDADFGDNGYHVDGFGVDLNRSLSGVHLVQVVVYTDENENGQFDRGTDHPCLVDGTVLQAGGTLDFSDYPTATPTRTSSSLAVESR
jgi:hypothetical protein